MTAGRPLRVGLVGAGMVSTHHLIGWSRCADGEVVAIADPDAGRAAAQAGAFGVPGVHDGIDALLAAGGIDVVDVCAPMARHAEIVRAAAARGVDVICQKPLAPTAAEAAALVADVADAIRLVVHENWRFRDHYRTIRAWIDDGVVGLVGTFLMTHFGAGHSRAAGDPPPALVRQPFQATLDRLLVWETLIHHLDTLTYLLGPLTLSAARLARLSDAVVGEDTATLTFRAGGAAGVLVACSSAIGAGPRSPDTLAIHGRDGSIVFDGIQATATRADGHRETLTFDPVATYQASYDAAIAHYARCLRTGAPFESPPQEHLAILDLAEAIYAVGKP